MDGMDDTEMKDPWDMSFKGRFVQEMPRPRDVSSKGHILQGARDPRFRDTDI
jgi:hypothetical protein